MKFLILFTALIFATNTFAKEDRLDKLINKVNRFHDKSFMGVASWYGPGFHGRKTANGERFNMHAMTAAHKTLPMNCYVRVTNPENGKSVVVKINDRGPFHGNRALDLSKGAAKVLGITKRGYGKVEYKVIRF